MNFSSSCEKLLPANGKPTGRDEDASTKRSLDELLESEGIGLFHVALLAFMAIGYAGAAMSYFAIAWVLPEADVELKLNSEEKGWINALSTVGNVLGALSGTLSDSIGRKKIVIFCSFLLGFSNIAASFSVHSAMFMICNFFSGFGSGCYIPTAWAYVGEFFTTRRRGFMVMLWAVSSELGHVSLSVIGWLLLGTLLGDSRAFTVHGFSFSKWRVFLILVSISSLLACVLVCFLPESPEYLITTHQQVKLRKVLQKIYKWNSCHKTHIQHQELLQMDEKDQIEFESSKLSLKKKILLFIKNTMEHMARLFKPPYLFTTITAFFAAFTVCYGYIGVQQWFPEYFKRLNINGSLCEHTNYTVNNQFYQETIVVTAGSLFGALLGVAFVEILGSKGLLIFSMAMATVSAVGLWYFKTAIIPAMAAAFAYSAMTVLAYDAQQLYVFQKYETEVRTIAIGFFQVSGKSGAVLSALMFGYFIDCNIFLVILITAGITTAGGVTSLFLPSVKMKQQPYLHRLVARILKYIRAHTCG